MRKRLIFALGVVLLLVAAIAANAWYRERQSAAARQLTASGMLEATEVNLASELGGQLATLPVREGEPVREGTVVATFDTELLDHQIATAPDLATRLHLERERARQTLRSPLDGWVVRTVFEPDEIVPPGSPVAVVADWRALTLKVYLPEDQFGRVSLGQTAQVTVDAYRGETFTGQVSFISSEAEFTPRTVQTQEDRVKSVYAIKLRVPNNDLRLKPGMFADTVFAVADSSNGR
jgi:multidrug resistance efflux pump